MDKLIKIDLDLDDELYFTLCENAKGCGKNISEYMQVLIDRDRKLHS